MELNDITKSLFDVFSRDGIEEGLDTCQRMIRSEMMNREKTLKCKLIPNKNGILPKRQTEHAAGYDLYSPEDVTLPAKELTRVPLGICIEIPEGLWGEIKSRSSLAVKRLHAEAGVIDSDYRGEVTVVLENHSSAPYNVKQGERIAQIIFQKYEVLTVEEVDELDSTVRGEGGFGSTGKVDPLYVSNL